MHFGRLDTPDCTCAVCLVLRRLVRDSHQPGVPVGTSTWLCEQLRWVHGALLDKLELPAPGGPPAGSPLIQPPVAAGGKGDPVKEKADTPSKAASAPAGAVPVKTEAVSESGPLAEPPVGQGEAPEEKGETSDPGQEGQESKAEKGDKKEILEEIEEEVSAEERERKKDRHRSPTERARSSGIKRKRDKSSDKKKKKKERERRTPSKSPPRGDHRRGPVDGSARPKSPDHPPRHRQERPTFPRVIPAASRNPALRDPPRPPGHWGGKAPGGQKGKVRRERWRDIKTYGANDERKKQREERKRR